MQVSAPHVTLQFVARLHATSLVLAQQAVVRDLWSPPVVTHSLPHPSVRTEHTPMDQTPALLDSAFGCSTAPQHMLQLLATRQNQHRSPDCSSCPSIHRECGDRVGRFHRSSRRAVLPLGPSTRSQSLRHLHWLFVPVHRRSQSSSTARVIQGVATRPVTATPLCLLTRLGIASLSRTLVDRSGTPSHSQACPVPVISCREALSDSRMQT